MNPLQINGFLIVRIPQFNFDTEFGPYFEFDQIPKLNGVQYNGVGRISWDNLDVDFRNKTLPQDLHNSFRLMEEERGNYATIKICDNFNSAKTLLEYSNKDLVKNELLAVQSERLAELKPTFIFNEKKIEWLGYDVFYLRGWSLLESGIFFKPDNFLDWKSKINENGLFNTSIEASLYLNEYLKLASINKVEEVPDEFSWIDILKVGRVVIEGSIGPNSVGGIAVDGTSQQ